MITISVQSNIAQVVASFVRNTPKRQAQATAWAINEILVQAKNDTIAEMKAVFHAPTAWTLNSMRIDRAGPKTLAGRIYFRSEAGKGIPAAKYISTQITGGVRPQKRMERALQSVGVLPEGYITVPGSAANIDQFGNMSLGQIKQILSYFQAATRGAGSTQNTTAEKKERMRKGTKMKRGIQYFVGSPAGGRLPYGIYQRITQFARHGDSTSVIKPLLIFVKAASYAPRLGFKRVIERRIAKSWDAEFSKAWKLAGQK